MIEINLIAQRKTKGANLLSGLNLSTVKWKFVLIFTVLWLGGQWYLEDEWNKAKNILQTEQRSIDTESKNLDKEIVKNKDVKEMLTLFAEQEKKLKARADLVNEILRTKINPEKVLERLARDIPEDVWINEITVNPDKGVSITGQALTYKDIGDFIVRANESKYFNKSLSLKSSSTEELNVKSSKRRVEKFTIAGTVSSFE
ncbi:MAG: PilN domain-containing protein [Pseudomonadota bacterium]